MTGPLLRKIFASMKLMLLRYHPSVMSYLSRDILLIFTADLLNFHNILPLLNRLFFNWP